MHVQDRVSDTADGARRCRLLDCRLAVAFAVGWLGLLLWIRATNGL